MSLAEEIFFAKRGSDGVGRANGKLMATEAKKHHFVPQSVLPLFSINGDGKKIYVFDKLTSRCWPSAISDAGSENYFNSLEYAGVRISFEQAFQEIDDRLALSLDRLASERTLASLGQEERADLADVIAVQLLRTKLIRTSMRTVAEDLAQSLADAGIDPNAVENFSIPTEQDARLAALQLLAERHRFRTALATKAPLLIEARDEQFWISDNPVVMFNTFSYGETGLNAPGIEIYYPFAPDLTLGFFCNSIVRKLEEATALPAGALRVEKRKRFVDLRDAIKTGRPTPLADNASRFLNELQVRRSSRFLYSSVDDFAPAREVLTRCPEMRSVTTHMSVGKMGIGPAARTNMPHGLWLVVYGRVSTRDLRTLSSILHDEPLQQAVLFQDGAERYSMREIRMELIGERSCPQRMRIVHNDDSLNAIIAR